MRAYSFHRSLRAALALGVGAALVAPAFAGATHVRPQGATPLRLPLVPAYNQCAAPNRTHGAPLAYPSCRPPALASSYLTVGTPDANGAHARSVGFVNVRVRSTDYDQIVIAMRITDVRCRPPTDTSVCATVNAAGGPDYSGELQGNATIRISDHFNGPSLTEAATVQDIPFPVNAPCVATTDTSTGAICDVAFAPAPGVTIPPQDNGGRRTVVEFAQFQLFDGGADGNVGSAGNTLFAVQGLFVP